MFDEKIDLSSFVLEVTRECNHKCLYCYNVWKCQNVKYPIEKELTTEQIKDIISRLKKETRIKHLAISGGEPLLRKDTPEIIRFCSENFIRANLITNGSLLSEEKCKECVDAKTSIFEVPLLTLDERIHHRLTGRNDLKEVVGGIKNLKKFNTKLVLVFVATKLNINQIEKTAKTAIALGADGIMFNRFNPGGAGIKNQKELMPSLEEVKKALRILDGLVGYYGVRASASVPIPKCLVNSEDYKNINFGYCPSGNEKSYYTIDPCGNVRICNHTPSILGNLLGQDLGEVLKNPHIKKFQESFPDHCKNCKELKTCWGGCKASAQVCEGSLCGCDPFLKENISNG